MKKYLKHELKSFNLFFEIIFKRYMIEMLIFSTIKRKLYYQYLLILKNNVFIFFHI
jgi:hypothetical protein